MFEFHRRLPGVDPPTRKLEQQSAETMFGRTLGTLDDVQVVDGGHRLWCRRSEIGRLFASRLPHPLARKWFDRNLVALWQVEVRCKGNGSNRIRVGVLGAAQQIIRLGCTGTVLGRSAIETVIIAAHRFPRSRSNQFRTSRVGRYHSAATLACR